MCEYKNSCKHYLPYVCKGEYLQRCDQRKALNVFNALQGTKNPVVPERSYKCLRCEFTVKSKLQYEFCPKCAGIIQEFDPLEKKIKELKNPFGE